MFLEEENKCETFPAFGYDNTDEENKCESCEIVTKQDKENIYETVEIDEEDEARCMAKVSQRSCLFDGNWWLKTPVSASDSSTRKCGRKRRRQRRKQSKKQKKNMLTSFNNSKSCKEKKLKAKTTAPTIVPTQAARFKEQ